MTGVHLTTPSPEPSSTLRSEARYDSPMASESERSAGCYVAGGDIAARGNSVLSESSLSTSQAAGNTCANSDMSATKLNSQQPEITLSYLAGGTAHDKVSFCVRIDDLPDEILIKIFSHLSFIELIDIAQKVSSRWRRLSQDSDLWIDKEYHIRYFNSYISDKCRAGMTDQEAIQTFCDAPNLRKVCMQRCAKSRVFRALYSRCRRLGVLRLASTQKLSYSVLKNLVEKCSEIHTLRIPNDLLQSEKFSEAFSQLQHLRVLDLDELFTYSTPVLRPLGDGCPRLAYVDFGRTTVDVDDLRHFLNAKRNTLKTIRIKWAMAGKRCILPLLTVCADSLERLELYEFDILDKEATEAFTALGSLKNLQELTMAIRIPPPRGSAALAFTSGGLPKLRRLDLQAGYGLDDGVVIAASRGCPALRELILRDAKLLTDAAFSQIYCLEHLEILDVSCCRGLGGGLISYLAGLPRLHTLIMQELEFPKLQPGLCSLVELSSLRYLLLHYSLVSGLPFDKFPGKLVNLRELNIRGCRGNPKATDGLMEQMPNLEIYGRILVEDSALDTEGHKSDVELAEVNEESAGVGKADKVRDDNSGSD